MKKYINDDDFIYGNREEGLYDIKNPADDYFNNLLLILSKYDYDIYKNRVSDVDNKELMYILMSYYEDTISEFEKTLRNFIIGLLKYKYDHEINVIAEIDKYRAIIRKMTIYKDTERCSKTTEERLKFINDILLSEERIISVYYSCVEFLYEIPTCGDISEKVNMSEDIKDIKDPKVFSTWGFIEYLNKYNTDNNSKVTEEINNHLLDNYFNDFRI